MREKLSTPRPRPHKAAGFRPGPPARGGVKESCVGMRNVRARVNECNRLIASTHLCFTDPHRGKFLMIVEISLS